MPPSEPEAAPLFHVIDARVFDRVQLDDLCDLTTRVRLLAKHPDGARFLLGLLPDRRAMLYFVQPSTRTFLSFNNACHVLGIRTSEIRDPATSSEVKGESFEDSIRTFSSYVDVIVMRTPDSGKAARAAELMNRIPRPVPIINAGSNVGISRDGAVIVAAIYNDGLGQVEIGVFGPTSNVPACR